MDFDTHFQVLDRAALHEWVAVRVQIIALIETCPYLYLRLWAEEKLASRVA